MLKQHRVRQSSLIGLAVFQLMWGGAIEAMAATPQVVMAPDRAAATLQHPLQAPRIDEHPLIAQLQQTVLRVRQLVELGLSQRLVAERDLPVEVEQLIGSERLGPLRPRRLLPADDSLRLEGTYEVRRPPDIDVRCKQVRNRSTIAEQQLLRRWLAQAAAGTGQWSGRHRCRCRHRAEQYCPKE